jgi:hypothetical protein
MMMGTTETRRRRERGRGRERERRLLTQVFNSYNIADHQFRI